MHTNPLVAIVIPCYNQGHFLAEAVASVVGQTVDCWEIVIVDDGSTDDTATIAEWLIERLPKRRIVLIRQSNRGLGASRNRGIAASSAPYILPLDADDMLAPTYLARTMPVLDGQAQIGFVTTNARFFGAEWTWWSGGEPTAERLLYDCRMLPTTLFRRSAWQQATGFDEQRRAGYEDWDFWLRLVDRGWQGRLVAAPLVWYRRRPESMLNHAQRHDLHLRAQLAADHARLYPTEFSSWAAGVLAAAHQGRLGEAAWWRWYAIYALLVARHAPSELPKTLFRPFFKRLGPQRQMYARRLARMLRLSRAR